MPASTPTLRIAVLGIGAVVVLAAGVALGVALAGPPPAPTSPPVAAASDPIPPSARPTPAPTRAPTPTPSPTPSPSPTPAPTPTPEPTPKLVPAPLTGLPVREAVARRPVIAVMVDDHWDARPQSGYTDASVVWQAPAEGGIPRYMLLFHEGDAPSIGPVRSARHYFIAWAAEWNAVYVHVGGSPLALRTLRSSQGRGGLVFDADEYRWGGGAGYLWRSRDRFAPHNVYTDGEHLRKLAKRVGAKAATKRAAWRFGPDAPLGDRPVGGRIDVPYDYNRVVYRYHRATNRYLRSVTGESRQTDATTGKRVGPKNVVVLFVSFSPLRDGTNKHRLEADVVGSGTALIATNGTTVSGTWRKKALDTPTLLFGPDGEPVTLTAGQTFVQVVPVGTKVVVKDGAVPPKPPRPAGAGDPHTRGPEPR